MERYLRVNLLGPGPRLMKKNLPSCGLTKVEKCCFRSMASWLPGWVDAGMDGQINWRLVVQSGVLS